ncbi:MAG: cytochrome c3 family protein [Deltaproteobacteria bacterium]|nr:MAG: cytochrome c3 family protein [Deltaproteobacteria bacterium]
MKRIWLLSLLTLSATWLLTGASFANEKLGMKAPEAEIIIEGEKKSARFSHPVHLGLGVTCGQCHHDSEHQSLTDKDIASLDNNLQLRCASCHNKDFADPKLQTPKSAFHARCKECHKKGVDGKKGPTKCTDCHVKKAK